MQNFLENDHAEYLLKDQIIHVTYKNGVYIDLRSAVQIVKDRLLLHEGRTFPVLCDARGIRFTNKSARDYFAIEGSTLITAVAFITEPPVSELVTEFYLRTNKPPIPTRTFKNASEALTFLNKF